ncbi:MAG: hypothetical protein CR975_07040 [Gammaproteobacteria bacterium]|nr:MAG: hypothetical protein CR975_07040 [Gammaproteobacteria bacterium]
MTPVWAKMPYLSYRFSGTDAKTFLQGQLTQDIHRITPVTCHYGAYCNPKGRMLANVLLSAEGNDIIARLHQRQAESVIKRLQLFVLRSQVEITPLRDLNLALNQPAAEVFCHHWGVVLPEPFSALSQDDFHLLALPNDYYELRSRDMAVLSFLQSELAENFAAIERRRIAGGNFHILPETSELLLPQQTPLEAWGGISYNKGCYVGQEIIARNKYRGKVRKGLALAQLADAPCVALGTKIRADDCDVGTVIESHQDSDVTLCLALMLLEDVGNTCQIGDTTAVFTLIEK